MPAQIDFGTALRELKAGKRVARLGWNGKNMYVTYKPGYPDGVIANDATRKAHQLSEGAKIVYRPYLEMLTADGSLVPWLASQTDLLAEDWVVI